MAIAHNGVMDNDQASTFQPRYVAYAKMHGKSPEAMIVLDQSRGGIGAWFSPWIRDRWAEFDTITGRKYRIGDGHTTEGHAKFDAWLDGGCQNDPEYTKPEPKNVSRKVNDLATLLLRAKQAATDADPGEGLENDGGTCNLDTPAFRIDRWRESDVMQAAEVAGVQVTAFTWMGGRRWFWLNGCTKGQANRRCRMMEAAQSVIREGETLIAGFHACGYCQCD
jgi:hypothetical protein